MGRSVGDLLPRSRVQGPRKTLVGASASLVRRAVTPGRLAVAFGLAGLLYRVFLVALDVPPANSDEGAAALAALHIGEGRHWPIFFYGQDYMGTLHSYLAAPFVQALGTHWWVMRIPTLAMYALFLFLVFRLTRTLYTPWFATLAVVVMALGSDRVVKDQIIGAGGYSDVATATAGLMLAATALALRLEKRQVTYLLGGLLAGYIVWTHWLALPYVAVAVLLVGWAGRSVLTKRHVLLAAAGFICGVAPLIWFNIRSGHPNSLSVLLSLSGATETAAWSDRIHGGVILGLPLSSGMCAPSRCETWQLWWGPVYLGLMVVAVVIAIVGIRRSVDPDERRLHAGRLALVIGGAVTLGAYVASASSALTPIESARYLHYGMVSLPAVVWPLWVGVKSAADRAVTGTPGDHGPGRVTVPRPTRGGVALAAACLVIAGAGIGSLLVATGQLIAHQPAYAAKADAERVLVDQLRHDGVTRVYSEYWTCNRLAYVSGEQIRCAVLDEDLTPGFDRYRPYREQVRQSELVAYVLPTASAMAENFARSAPSTTEILGVRNVAGYQVYLCRQEPAGS
ncbi:ArnT family glycosyltransferase [Micromonospora sp. NPDC050417]|uniref:ArnT family glycosyltransferase n=1 Tax=Micromonospora sp. NPDC050417 TaxID=3364280 RepID=UPI0037AC013A